MQTKAIVLSVDLGIVELKEKLEIRKSSYD